MSEIMIGVLSMPDELFWHDDPLTRSQHNSIRKGAAETIAVQQARIAELEKALEPFAKEFGQWNPEVYGDDCPITAGPIVEGYEPICGLCEFTIGDLRRAAELLEGE